jgi:hypothetical protein|tara:strand:+ start:512 stop:829 length:318 start_codon:yes stop_codon:yes gene_type:complete
MEELVDEEKSIPTCIQVLRDQLGCMCICMMLVCGIVMTATGATGGATGTSDIFFYAVLPVGLVFIVTALTCLAVYLTWRILRLKFKAKYDAKIETMPVPVQQLLS